MGIKKNFAFTFLEMIAVIAIFSLITLVIYNVFLSSNMAYKKGSIELELQQSARLAMDNSVNLLRKSASIWRQGTIEYPATITNGDRIDFYIPIFDANNVMTDLKHARICLSIVDSSHLVRRIGSPGPEEIIGVNINNSTAEDIFQFTSADSRIVEVKIPVIHKGETFSLTSRVKFRNSSPTEVDPGVIIGEIPEEGQ